MNTFANQKGAALVVSLLLLTVLTILALSASQTTRLQERMAGNARDVDVAFQASESGVRSGENWLAELKAKPDSCTTAVPCDVYQVDWLPIDLSNQGDAWWATNGRQYGKAGKELTVAKIDPVYVIEETDFVKDDLTEGNGPPNGKQFYRISSIGTGATDVAKVVVQTTYTRRY
jgi:type IV pilus assembly protein PilX